MKTGARTLLFSALLLSATPNGTPSHAAESQRSGPIMMGVMGDSISAATLADVPIPGDRQSIMSIEPQELKERVLLENKLTLSWASGIAIRSHYIRLLHYLRRKGDRRVFYVNNVSYPGRTSSAMEGQALKLVEDFKSGGYSEIKYITLLIGSNDACSSRTPWGVPPSEMRDNLMRAFRVLASLRQKEPIRVLVVGIPRIPELAEPHIRESKTIFGLSCEIVRNKVLGECNSLLTWKNEAEYDQKMMIIENDNRMLRSVVQEVNNTFSNIEAVYSDRLYNLNIPRSILAADCFHPAADGQQRLADEVWLDQPWFD